MKKFLLLLVLCSLSLGAYAQQWFIGGQTTQRSFTVTYKDTNSSTDFKFSGNTFGVIGGIMGEYMRIYGEYNLEKQFSADGFDVDYKSYAIALDFYKKFDLLLPFVGAHAETINLTSRNADLPEGLMFNIEAGLMVNFRPILASITYSTSLTEKEKNSFTLKNNNTIRIGVSFAQ